MIRGKVTGQVLQLAKNTTVSDSKNYISARFVFSLDWLGLTKTVHFKNGENQADVTLVDDGITQDRGIDLSAGTWDVWLHGAAYNESTGELEERITTTSAKLVVLPYQTTTGEPFRGNNASAVEIEVGKAVVAASKAEKARDAAEASANSAASSEKTVSTLAAEVKRNKEAVDNNLKSTESAKKEAKAWAIGDSDIPETVDNNAKFYSEVAKQVATKNGFCHLGIDDSGHLILDRTENIKDELDFELTDSGHLEVIYND
nr:MAG TPA: hypothetical protein [Caudoviricetes sp.]